MDDSKVYVGEIPNSDEFAKERGRWRSSLADSENLRKEAISLTISSGAFKYGYQWEWCGVPIIRHPDDIVLQQEIMWELKPTRVIETGVARGGSIALSSTLMDIASGGGKVLGLDIQILPHTTESLGQWLNAGTVTLQECDTSSETARSFVKDFLANDSTPALLILDSNHTHDHVLAELTSLASLLPAGSVIMVADTIIEEMPNDYYPDRPWGKGNNPLTAVNTFLKSNQDFSRSKNWSRRSLMGEFRDGIIDKVN